MSPIINIGFGSTAVPTRLEKATGDTYSGNIGSVTPALKRTNVSISFQGLRKMRTRGIPSFDYSLHRMRPCVTFGCT